VLQHPIHVPVILALLASLRVFFRCRSDLALEILALRQQLAVFKRKQPRPGLTRSDRVFWVWLRGFWPRWKDVLSIVNPETVVGWHRSGFRLYWRCRSRSKKVGRPSLDSEMRALIRQMAQENPT